MAGSQYYSNSCKFTWDGGGREVFLSGSFNDWERIPMAKSRSQSGVFSTTVTLPQGRHEYKFLVDGEWVLDMNKERSTNELGIMNNVCWVPSAASDTSAAGLSQGSSCGGDIPEYTPPSPHAGGTYSIPLMEVTPRPPLLGVAPGAPLMEDSDSDSTDSSDTESVSSTTSGGPDLARQPSVKLAVRCYQAPQVLDKDKLRQHIGLLGLSGNVTGIQWKTSHKKTTGHALIRVSPPHMVDEVVMKLNGSMLLGKFKLSVKQHSRKRRGGRGQRTKKDKPSTKVFVGSLPQFITEAHLREHFSSFKEKIVKIEMAKENKKPKGFGFIFFSNHSSAKAAVQNMSQTLLQGKYRINVEMGRDDKPSLPSSSQAPPTSPSPLLAENNDSDTESVSSMASTSAEMCQVFVNSHPPLPDRISSKQIADHFSTYKNQITNAKVIRDKQRKSKGYAILTFTDQTLAEEAVLVYNNSTLLGQYRLSLRCKPTERKETSPKKVPKKRHTSSSEGQATGTSPLESEIPGTNSVPKSKKQQFPVKLTCLPPSFTRERLADLLRLYGVIHQLPKIFEGKNRYALANFKTSEGAQKAVAGLNKTVHDEHTIKVSLKESRTAPSASPTPQQEIDSPVSPSDISTGPIPVPIQPQPTTPINTSAIPVPTQPPHMAPINMGPIPVPPQTTHMPPFNMNPVPPPPQTTVLLDNVDPLVTLEELKMVAGVSVEWAKRTPSLPTQVVLRLSSHEHAQRVVQVMNGMKLLDKVVQATIVSTPTIPPMNSPFQRSASYPATPPYYQSHDPHPPSQSFPPPPHPHPIPPSAAPHLPTSGPMPHPPGIQQTLKLAPSDWNRLMFVGGNGRVLFQDIVEPYQSNPSIRIIPKMESLTILFEGHPDAVNSAYGRVCAEVHKEITVPDRLRKAALVELRPDLPTTLQQRCGVTLTGYDNSSSPIRLEGNHTHFPAARQEVETAMGSIKTLELSLTLAPHLLNSARERFRVENVRGCAFNKDMGAGCVVFALTKSDIQRATQIFQGGFFVETVPNVSAEIYEKLAPTIQSQLVQVERQGSNLLLKSFSQTEVQKLATDFRQKKEAADLQQTLFDGTPDERAYLIHLHKTNTEARDFLSSLPAQCVIKKSSLLLKGNPQSVQAAQGAIRTRLLAGVSTRSFDLHCNEKFLSQVEDFVLRPVTDDVTWLKQKQAQSNSIQRQKSSGGRRRSAEESEMDVCLVICSKKAEVFQSVCSYLEEVRPSSKKLTLRKGAAQSIKLNEIKPDLEMKYRVRIIGREDLPIIHGLTGREVRECGSDIEERVESSHEIAQHIPVTQYQQWFLKTKREQELSELKEECSELHFLSPRNEGESFSLRIKGTVRRVDSVKERLSEMLNSLTTGKFSVSYEQRLYHMWKKRWDQIRKDRERGSDIIVFIDKQPPMTGQKGDTIATTTIHVVSTDNSEVEQVGDLISRTQTQTKTIKLTPSSATALRKDKKEFLWPLAVHFYIKPSNEAVLTAPEDCGEDLETAEEEIHKFLGEKTLTSKNLTSSDEVVGLVLNSSSKSATYLTTAASICKGRGVKVHALKKPQAGLRVSGTPAAIQEVEPLLVTRVIRPIEQSIGQARLSVKPMFKSIFSMASFRQFNSKLQDEMCVVCTYPRPTNTNKVVRSALIQPSSMAKCLKLQLCKGSIINEDSDAIVNAANEELKHIGGLAKAILDAGGLTVQTESDDYVREHGRVRVGQVVALGPGKLPCKAIIHAVGPRWNGGKSGEESHLYLTVYRSLETASLAGHGSVSLPAISTGVFGVPGSVCAKASLKAVQDFCQAHPDSALHTVRFVLYQQQELDDFCSHFDSSSIVKSISQGIPPTQVQSTPIPMSAIPTLATPTPSHSGVWEWENDHGSYTQYSSDIARQLSSSHSANPQGSCSFRINNNVYRIDFSSMRQTNLATGHQRQVRYNPSATPTTNGNVQWYYRDDSGGFSPYSPSDSQSIEAMYQSSSSGVIHIGSNAYTFDFGSMCQINTRTNYKRPIQRRIESSVTPAPPPAASFSSPATPTSESLPPPPPKDVHIILRGPQDSLEAAKAKLERKLANYVQKDTITIPFACSTEFTSKLQSTASKHGVIIDVSGKGGQKAQSVVKLEGINSEVQATVKAIQQLIIDHQVSSAESEQDMATPPEWEEQTRTTEVFQVRQGSAEWARVEQKFRATLSSSQIVTVSRIQNSWLWEKYCHHKKRLHLKNSGVVNEKELFHGTRGNDPKLIYEGENGFDMRYSNQGMWGQANYFAVNASYSNSYAFHTPDGYKEMFLVKVLTGDSYNCASNSSLRKPPEKPMTSGGGKVQFSKMDYDTVTGYTSGSNVYMTYDNDKAYPAYLIKYR